MAVTAKKLASGTFGTSSATLYTAPAATQGIVKNIKVCNKNASAAKYVTILFDGVEVVYQHSIAAKDTINIPCSDVIEATKLITGLAESADVTYYISGYEKS